MPKAFSERERELITARLLEAGHKLFAAYGLKKTNVEEIAAAAGVSKGAFYLFYDSKEAFFMDVVEQVERRYRQEILAEIARPGPSPRARLLAAFKHAMTQWKTIPILQVFNSGEYEALARRIPPGKLQEHLASDRAFIEELVAHCRAEGIPIQAPAEEIGKLMYALLFASLHEEDFGSGGLAGALDVLLELVAAYCLGEVTMLQSVGLPHPPPPSPRSAPAARRGEGPGGR